MNMDEKKKQHIFKMIFCGVYTASRPVGLISQATKVNGKTGHLRKALESNGLKISRLKT